MKILIAPFAAKLPTGHVNAKNFHRWPEVVAMLNAQGHEVIQIAKGDEPRIEGVGQFITNWPLQKLRDLINFCDVWISVDSFLPHFCATDRLKGGVVIWSQSNPKIWGYPHNTNLLKSKEYLREYQYAPWFDVPFNPDAFVSPEEVVKAVNERLLAKAA